MNLETALSDMAAHGVDVMVSSPNTLGEVAHLDVAEAIATTQLLNDESARAQHEYPDRFVGLAMLPVKAYWPLFERIGELGIPLFLHPPHRSMTLAAVTRSRLSSDSAG